MGSDLVTKALIVLQSPVCRFDGKVAVVAVPEFDACDVVGTFDATVELRPLGRQHEDMDIQSFAGRLEVGADLAAAVDLGGDEGKRDRRKSGSGSSTPRRSRDSAESSKKSPRTVPRHTRR